MAVGSGSCTGGFRTVYCFVTYLFPGNADKLYSRVSQNGYGRRNWIVCSPYWSGKWWIGSGVNQLSGDNGGCYQANGRLDDFWAVHYHGVNGAADKGCYFSGNGCHSFGGLGVRRVSFAGAFFFHATWLGAYLFAVKFSGNTSTAHGNIYLAFGNSV